MSFVHNKTCPIKSEHKTEKLETLRVSGISRHEMLSQFCQLKTSKAPSQLNKHHLSPWITPSLLVIRLLFSPRLCFMFQENYCHQFPHLSPLILLNMQSPKSNVVSRYMPVDSYFLSTELKLFCHFHNMDPHIFQYTVLRL